MGFHWAGLGRKDPGGGKDDQRGRVGGDSAVALGLGFVDWSDQWPTWADARETSAGTPSEGAVPVLTPGGAFKMGPVQSAHREAAGEVAAIVRRGGDCELEAEGSESRDDYPAPLPPACATAAGPGPSSDGAYTRRNWPSSSWPEGSARPLGPSTGVGWPGRGNQRPAGYDSQSCPRTVFRICSCFLLCARTCIGNEPQELELADQRILFGAEVQMF